MLVGVPPYFNPDKGQLFKNIESGPLKIPHTMPVAARALILSLLNRNSNKRLGAGQLDASEIKNSEFFAEIDWEKVKRKEYPVPKPKCKSYTEVNERAVCAFYNEEKESEEKLNEYFTSQTKKTPHSSVVEDWSFVREGDQGPAECE